MSDARGFVPAADNHIDGSGIVLIEGLPDLSLVDFRTLVQLLVDRDKYGQDTAAALVAVVSAIVGNGSRIKLTDEGGVAVLATNRSGGALAAGEVVEPFMGWDLTDGGGTGYLTNLSLTGASSTNTNVGEVYFKISQPGGNTTVEVYSDAARTTKVAGGALVGNGAGTVTLAAEGASGLSGTVDVAATPADDSGYSALMGSLRGVKKAVTSSTEPCGVVYDGGADGADVWIVVAGEAQVKVAANVPFGAWLITSATTAGGVDVLYAADATKVQRGVARSIGRRAGVGTTVGARLDLGRTWGV